MAIYRIYMEKFPGNHKVWVSKLEQSDPIWEYNNLVDAENKRFELDDADPTERTYTVKIID